jgi:chromosome segregation ATPase
VSLDPQDERQVLEGQIIMVESENCKLRNALYNAAASFLIICQRAERIEDTDDALEIRHFASSSRQLAVEAIESPSEVFAQRIAQLERENAALKEEFRQAIKQVNTLSREAAHFEGKCKLKTQLLKRTEEEVAALRVQLEDMTDQFFAVSQENAALRQDKERLDWLATSSMWLDVPGTESFTPETLRAAIDAARGEGGAS